MFQAGKEEEVLIFSDGTAWPKSREWSAKMPPELGGGNRRDPVALHDVVPEVPPWDEAALA
eukprot:2263580-Pyramimonas_sp.AAC.1